MNELAASLCAFAASVRSTAVDCMHEPRCAHGEHLAATAASGRGAFAAYVDVVLETARASESPLVVPFLDWRHEVPAAHVQALGHLVPREPLLESLVESLLATGLARFTYADARERDWAVAATMRARVNGDSLHRMLERVTSVRSSTGILHIQTDSDAAHEVPLKLVPALANDASAEVRERYARELDGYVAIYGAEVEGERTLMLVKWPLPAHGAWTIQTYVHNTMVCSSRRDEKPPASTPNNHLP